MSYLPTWLIAVDTQRDAWRKLQAFQVTLTYHCDSTQEWFICKTSPRCSPADVAEYLYMHIWMHNVLITQIAHTRTSVVLPPSCLLLECCSPPWGKLASDSLSLEILKESLRTGSALGSSAAPMHWIHSMTNISWRSSSKYWADKAKPTTWTKWDTGSCTQ